MENRITIKNGGCLRLNLSDYLRFDSLRVDC